jgi:hypothetical protein
MLVLLLMLAGLAVMLGSNVAGRIVKVVLGLCLLLVAVQWLMQMGACLMSGMVDSPTSWLSNDFLVLISVAGLGLVGAISWRLRADMARARDLISRRHGAPRSRALPPPPSSLDGGQ